MSEQADPLLDAVTALVPPLLRALDGLGHAGRHLHPPELPQRAGQVGALIAPLAAGLSAFRAPAWPAGLEDFRRQLETSADHALQGLDGFASSTAQANPTLAAYRALGSLWRALEALYPLASVLPPVSRFFLNEAGRADPSLAARLAGADLGRDDAGVMHADNATDERGGFSLYLPEYQRADQPMPLVVALHGGSGHGRGFLWSWLKDARSAGCALIAPTSCGDTWALADPDRDTRNLEAMVAHISERWPMDASRVLLTGMSDGATFSWLAGLRERSPFTHLAPVAGTFHPMLLEAAGAGRLSGLPVYLVHGALDWMFAVDVARMARDALTAAGAAVVYRELQDLSHTYPGEETARILEWFMRQSTAC